jgi:hypothetical protein
MNSASGGEAPAHQVRLQSFRSRNPSVLITQHDGFGYWQAWIPVAEGGTLVTRHALPELLDALEELDGSPLLGG